MGSEMCIRDRVYIADLFICARGKIVVNTLTFVVIHLVIFGVCYRISWKSALFQSILLAAITSACEFLVIFIPYIRIIPDNTIAMTSSQSLILTFASKLLYLIGIMIISRVFCKKQKNVQATSLGLLSIPILTVIIIMLVMKVNTTSHLLSLVCFILIIMNIIIFAINQKLMIMETDSVESRFLLLVRKMVSRCLRLSLVCIFLLRMESLERRYMPLRLRENRQISFGKKQREWCLNRRHFAKG